MAIGNNNQSQNHSSKISQITGSRGVASACCWLFVRRVPLFASSQLCLSPRGGGGGRWLAGWLAVWLVRFLVSFAGSRSFSFSSDTSCQQTLRAQLVLFFFLFVSRSAHYGYNTRIRKLTSSLLFRFERKVSSFPLFLFLICYYSLFYFWFLFSYSVRPRLWVRECVCVCVCMFVFFSFSGCGFVRRLSLETTVMFSFLASFCFSCSCAAAGLEVWRNLRFLVGYTKKRL